MNKTRNIALSGVLLALSVITLYAETIFPTGRLSLYAISSFLVAIVVLESGIKAGWVFYIASLLLSAILIPDKLALVPYGLFFGVYAMIKYYVERMDKKPVEIVLKLIFFNLSFGLAYILAKEVLLAAVNIPALSMVIVLAVLQIIFLVYDYAFSIVINYYRKRFLRR